jgi:hypothetical protein
MKYQPSKRLVANGFKQIPASPGALSRASSRARRARRGVAFS